MRPLENVDPQLESLVSSLLFVAAAEAAAVHPPVTATMMEDAMM